MLFADGKSTGDSRISGARGVATLTERSDAAFEVRQLFLLLAANEAPQDALLSIESIKYSLIPKGILSFAYLPGKSEVVSQFANLIT